MFEGLFHKKTKTHTELEAIRELSGTRAAILACEGFEESELFEPKKALEAVGVDVTIISTEEGKIRSWTGKNWGRSLDVDMTVLDAFDHDFDFLILPGGVINPDKLRNNPNAVAFVQSFVNKRRPIAAICHGVQTLIETGYVKGKTLTSWSSLRTDLLNAGANWIDEEVVVDHRLITSRKPADLPAFNSVMIREFIDYHITHTMPNTESYVVTL
ncbi:MAG: type 1 glutamine amidotransferase domain-containing protein [Bdellovibrionota bacterium]